VSVHVPSPTPGSLHFHFLCKAITEAHQPLFNPTTHLVKHSIALSLGLNHFPFKVQDNKPSKKGKW